MSPGVKNISHPVLALTMGDMNGIGPEVIIRSLADENTRNSAGYLIFGDKEVFNRYCRISGSEPFWDDIVDSTDENASDKPADFMAAPTGRTDSSGKKNADDASASLPLPSPGSVYVISPDSDQPDESVLSPGAVCPRSGDRSMRCIAAAAAACLNGKAHAMVTAPISKEAISLAGYQSPGHTEYLQELAGSGQAGMMLVNRQMRTGLVTIHEPLRAVSDMITFERVTQTARLFHQSLKRDFGIRKPRIAMLGLNPHAGDGGVLGTEEKQVIGPAVSALQQEGINVDGPWPSDGFFGSKAHRNYDLVLAMYHDQGLIPVKMEGFQSGVNVTIGLPLIRTSPDHGTAFPIAGKNMADAGSMTAAIHLAVDMAKWHFMR